MKNDINILINFLFIIQLSGFNTNKNWDVNTIDNFIASAKYTIYWFVYSNYSNVNKHYKALYTLYDAEYITYITLYKTYSALYKTFDVSYTVYNQVNIANTALSNLDITLFVRSSPSYSSVCFASQDSKLINISYYYNTSILSAICKANIAKSLLVNQKNHAPPFLCTG